VPPGCVMRAQQQAVREAEHRFPVRIKIAVMPLVNQFQITVRDFLPNASMEVITDRDRSTTTTVSNRLYDKLRIYADHNQLRTHIHRTDRPNTVDDRIVQLPTQAEGLPTSRMPAKIVLTRTRSATSFASPELP